MACASTPFKLSRDVANYRRPATGPRSPVRSQTLPTVLRAPRGQGWRNPMSGGHWLLLEAAAAGVLGDAEDHELGRLDRGHADLDHDLTGVDDVRRVGLRVALDVERLCR